MSPESPLADDVHALAAAGRIFDTESLMKTPTVKDASQLSQTPGILKPTLVSPPKPKQPFELPENPRILVPVPPSPPKNNTLHMPQNQDILAPVPPPSKSKKTFHVPQNRDILAPASVPGKSKRKSRKSPTQSAHSLRTPPIPPHITSLSGRTRALKHQQTGKMFKHPYYEPIKMNKYVAPKKIHRDEIQLCHCQKVVGVAGCRNRKCSNVRHQRECPPNCTLGQLCTNKRFSKMKQPRCIRFRTQDRGYGVKAVERIPKGTFICEYVGEVIDNDEKHKRHQLYVKMGYPPDYFMIVDDDRIIDATTKGNISRFFNHSCEPNAELQCWTVDGVKRIGIFSIKNISPGEEITFNYGPSYHHIKCHCGAPSCTGWINGYGKNEK